MFRAPLSTESATLVELAVSTGLFSPTEAQALLGGTLEAYHSGTLGERHAIGVWADDASDAPLGWAYFAPDPYADAVWNLWWIGVTPAHHGSGAGPALLAAVEQHVREASGRLLIIETSALPPLARARRFYARSGYVECGRVPDFYADGESKVIFARRLRAP